MVLSSSIILFNSPFTKLKMGVHEISILAVIGAIIVAYLGLFFLYEKFFIR